MPYGDYRAFIEKKRAEYKKYLPVYSPALKEWIHFNAEGFGHLRFRTNGKPREISEQMYKLNLLRYAPLIIAKAKKIEEKETRSVHRGSIVYWSVVGHVKNVGKIRVILRKTESQTKHYFWSIMKIK